MITDLTFKTNSIFDSVAYDKDTNAWYFSFADNIYASSSGFWRLLKANRIVFVSLDIDCWYGML